MFADITTVQYAMLTLLYFRIWLGDLIDYYHTLLLLYLPAYMFNHPIIHIKQRVYKNINSSSDSDSSDSSDVYEEIEFEVFISKLEFELNHDNAETSMICLNGRQLLPFIDDMGKFHISHIQKFIPNLTKINIDYIKCAKYDQKIMYDVSRIIDVHKKIDTLNNQSCRLGVVF